VKLESLATRITTEPLTVDAALHLFSTLINELEALHASGKFSGDISLSTVFCGVDGGNVKLSSRSRAHVEDSLELAQTNDIKALGLVMYSVLNGNPSLGTAANNGVVDFHLPLDIPVWLSIIVRRMVKGDEDLSISEIRRVVVRNLGAKTEVPHLGSWSEHSLTSRTPFGSSTRLPAIRSANSHVEPSLAFSLLPHIALLLAGLIAGLSERTWDIGSPVVLIPFFLCMSSISFLPLIALKAADGELLHALRHWLRGSFYLSIWMLISYLGAVMYIDIGGTNGNWPNTPAIESATWLGAAVVSIESILHGVVLAPAVPEMSLTENLMSGGVSYGNSGKSLVACYLIFVFGFICLAVYYSNFKITFDEIRSYAYWIGGILLVELLLLFSLESVISLLPTLVFVDFLSIEVHLRLIALFFGISNTVVFWWFILSCEGESSLLAGSGV
jgi:hypothetical protein